MGEFALGQPVPRFEDPRLLRGGGRYVDDMVLPRMVFGHVLRSPHAHARIRSIDMAAAKAAPGVLAVLTGADWAGLGLGRPAVAGGLRRRDGSPSYRPRFPALVKDRVRWVGDYVAFVVAETTASGDRCGRTDRGRVRAAAGDRLDRGRGEAGRPAGLGGMPRQYLLRPYSKATRRRPRRRSPAPTHVVTPPVRHQPGDRRDDGAARRDRRLRCRRGSLHDLHDLAAHPRLSRRAGAAGAARCRRAACASSPAISAAALA